MSKPSWGDTKLKIMSNSYLPSYTEMHFTEIPTIPSFDNTSKPILQQGGRSRRRVRFVGFVKTWQEYLDLENDYLQSIEKEFTGPEGDSQMMIIELLRPYRRTFPVGYEYEISLLEV